MYYVGLLAGANDIDFVEHTRQGRDINRRGYSIKEAEAELQRPVVKRLLRLMEFRNSHPAFESNEVRIVDEMDGQILRISRTTNDYVAELNVDFSSRKANIRTNGPEGQNDFQV